MNNNIVEKHQVVIQWFQKIHKGDHLHCGQHYTWGQRVFSRSILQISYYKWHDMRIWQAIVCEPLSNTDDFIATTPARTAAQTSCQSKTTHKSFLLWISRGPDLFFSCASSSRLPSGPLRVAVLKRIVKAGGVGGGEKIHFITLLCSIFSTSLQSSNGRPRGETDCSATHIQQASF